MMPPGVVWTQLSQFFRVWADKSNLSFKLFVIKRAGKRTARCYLINLRP
jgi:hypothetical protein